MQSYRRSVHKLVASAFLGRSHLEVNHQDGNKWNNKLSNLNYKTSSSNKQHAVTIGLMPSGQDVYNAKLSDEQVIKIRASYPFITQVELAKIYGVKQSTISSIVSYKSRKIK